MVLNLPCSFKKSLINAVMAGTQGFRAPRRAAAGRPDLSCHTLLMYQTAMSCHSLALDARCAAFDHGTRGRCLLPLSAFGASSNERLKAGDCVAWCASGANTAQVRALIRGVHFLFPIPD